MVGHTDLVLLLALAACTDGADRDAAAALATPGVLRADVVITSARDVHQLDGIERIDGSLTIDAPDLATLKLADLARVDGDVTCRRIGADVAAPSLIAVGGDLLSTCRSFATPALRSVSGDLSLLDFVDSQPLRMLTSVHGGLVLHGKTTLDAPRLMHVAFLRAVAIGEGDYNDLQVIDLPALSVIDTDLSISRTEIRTIRLPALRHVATISAYLNGDLCASTIEELALRTGGQVSELALNKKC